MRKKRHANGLSRRCDVAQLKSRANGMSRSLDVAQMKYHANGCREDGMSREKRFRKRDPPSNSINMVRKIFQVE